MNFLFRLLPAAFLLLLPLLAVRADTRVETARITWKKTVIDKVFRSEGVGVADFNKDGKMDIFVGDVWYEAPDWKMHVVRSEKAWDPIKYSESFCCFPEDFSGDGYADVIVIPFPGKECFWYENPGAKGDKWKPHLLTTSACNETPIYVDLFGKGKKVLVMAWQPAGKDNMGEMCYFTPGKDPMQPWEKHSISGPSQEKKEIPGTRRFSHGLGHGDVNGDGRIDVIIPQGWWEQPATVGGSPWRFHAVDLNPICADMYTYDVDGDGKADIVSSSAHQYGFWWHQQKPGKNGPAFVRHDLFLPPPAVAKLPADHKLSKDEVTLFNAVNKLRDDQKKAGWKMSPSLSTLARAAAETAGNQTKSAVKTTYKGTVKHTKTTGGDKFTPEQAAKELLPDLEKNRELASPALEIGVGFFRAENGAFFCAIVVGDSGAFSLPAQTHALHSVDINGDGVKDLVTGRRWWAHGPKGDAGPNDPAYLYWFEAVRGKDGMTTFRPHEIDDDSGIGTQFAIHDMNGDGLLDIIISNKKGVFLFLQSRKEN